MSPTRRDILKNIAGAEGSAALTPRAVMHAGEPVKTPHAFDNDAGRFDVDALLDAYSPEYLEGMIIVHDPHTDRRTHLKFELFCDGGARTEIRLSSFVDEHESITIGSIFADQYRLMVALASLGGDEP